MTPEERVEVRQRRLVGWADEIEKRTNLPQHEMLTVARVLRETANDLAVAVSEERERCAKLIDVYAGYVHKSTCEAVLGFTLDTLAKKIREDA